jgi:AraC-like DNA-binding protein
MVAASRTDADSLARMAAHAAASLIPAETDWRCARTVREAASANPHKVIVTRWTHAGHTPLKVTSDGSDTFHCVAINLKCAEFAFKHAGSSVIDGRLTAGVAQVTPPGVPTETLFATSADLLHLFVPQPVLEACYRDLYQHSPSHAISLDDPALIRDPVVERLSQALIGAQAGDVIGGKMFVEKISLAIVSRIVAHHYARSVRRLSPGAHPLPQWRLERVSEFVDAHLGEKIGLPEMASSAGLTRMHFAAQFRRATGMGPHEYLLRRRIDRAKQLLRDSHFSVLDIAISCGFESQPHFTTVFRKQVGEPPARWKASLAASCS